jgi:hypothetical protein
VTADEIAEFLANPRVKSDFAKLRELKKLPATHEKGIRPKK